MKLYHVRTENTKYYSGFDLKQAQGVLIRLANERRYRMGVRCFEQDAMSFSFLLGWEEIQVRFYIEEIELDR